MLFNATEKTGYMLWGGIKWWGMFLLFERESIKNKNLL